MFSLTPECFWVKRHNDSRLFQQVPLTNPFEGSLGWKRSLVEITCKWSKIMRLANTEFTLSAKQAQQTCALHFPHTFIILRTQQKQKSCLTENQWCKLLVVALSWAVLPNARQYKANLTTLLLTLRKNSSSLRVPKTESQTCFSEAFAVLNLIQRSSFLTHTFWQTQHTHPRRCCRSAQRFEAPPASRDKNHKTQPSVPTVRNIKTQASSATSKPLELLHCKPLRLRIELISENLWTLTNVEPFPGTAEPHVEPLSLYDSLPQTMPKLYWKNPKLCKLLGKSFLATKASAKSEELLCATLLRARSKGNFIMWNLESFIRGTFKVLCGTWRTLKTWTFYEWNLYVEPWKFVEWNLYVEPWKILKVWRVEPGGTKCQVFGRCPKTTPKLYWQDPGLIELLR